MSWAEQKKKKSKAIAGPALYCCRRLHRLSCRPLSQWTDQTHQHQQEKPEIAETANLTFTGRSPGSGQEKNSQTCKKTVISGNFSWVWRKNGHNAGLTNCQLREGIFEPGGPFSKPAGISAYQLTVGVLKSGWWFFPPFWSQLKSLFLQHTTTEKQEIQQTATA